MTVGLLITALTLGLRHGVDWDHIAAVADLSGSAESRRRGFVLSVWYALGHAAVVFVLGCGAILLGTRIPGALDDVMGRVVGLTLILLGAWVLVGLARHGRDFRLRSRWLLVLDGTFAGLRRVRTRRAGRSITIEHEHDHDHDGGAHSASFAHDHAHVGIESGVDADIEADIDAEISAEIDAGLDVGAVAGPVPPRRWLSSGRHVHRHPHEHELALPNSASARYHGGTATGIGMLHGVGVESPTQIAVFVASTSVVGAWGGLGLLLAWVVGLVAANCVLAVLAGMGVLHAERNFAVYATLAVLVAVMSIVMGLMFVVGIDALPELSL